MPGNFTDCFATLEVVVFAKKQFSCNFQAGWSWLSEDQARPQGHSTPVSAGVLVPAPRQSHFLRAWAGEPSLRSSSARLSSAILPRPGVGPCVIAFWNFSLEKKPQKFFLDLCSTSNVQGGFLHPLYLDHQRRSLMVTKGHSSK